MRIKINKINEFLSEDNEYSLMKRLAICFSFSHFYDYYQRFANSHEMFTNFSFTEKLVLICVLHSTHQQQYQQQFTDLFATSNKTKSQETVQIQKQPIQQQDPVQNFEEQSYRPITFPSGEELLTSDRIQPVPTFSTNLLQNVEQKTQPSIIQELTRPTRAVMAATVANIDSRYTDDQFDYVRDFAWKLFQV